MAESPSRPAGVNPAGRARSGLHGPVRRGQRGMVTAELAFASIGAALVCILLAWTLSLVGLVLRCQATAVEVARQEARGDRPAVVRAIAGRPAGAQVSVSRDGELVRVRLDLAARPWSAWLPAVPLVAGATVQQEPS